MTAFHPESVHPGKPGVHPPNLGGLVHLAPECHLVPPGRLAAGPGGGTTPSKPPLAFLFFIFFFPLLLGTERTASDWELEGQSQHPPTSSGRSASLKGLKHGAIRIASVLDVNLRSDFFRDALGKIQTDFNNLGCKRSSHGSL